jgi:hypothetical protein
MKLCKYCNKSVKDNIRCYYHIGYFINTYHDFDVLPGPRWSCCNKNNRNDLGCKFEYHIYDYEEESEDSISAKSEIGIFNKLFRLIFFCFK